MPRKKRKVTEAQQDTIATHRDTHTSQDESDRHSLDQLIRSHGFSIHSRPAAGEPVWSKRGRLFDQLDILANHLPPDDVACALFLEEERLRHDDDSLPCID